MRVLKKILLWLLLVAVLAALIVGGAVAWFYYNTDPKHSTLLPLPRAARRWPSTAMNGTPL